MYIPNLQTQKCVGMPPGPRGAGRAENDLTAVLDDPQQT